MGVGCENPTIEGFCDDGVDCTIDTCVTLAGCMNFAFDLLCDDFDECTVDGAHPTDLGFYRMARGIEPTVRRVLF